MEFFNGDDRVLYINILGKYLPIGCLSSNSMSETAMMMPTTTKENNGWESAIPTTQGYTISFSGIQVNSTLVGGSFNVASYDKIKLMKRDRTRIEWKIEGAKFPTVDYGSGYFSEIGEANTVGEFMTFNGSIQGFGKPLVTSKGTVVLNNGNPDIAIATDNTGTEVLRVSKF